MILHMSVVLLVSGALGSLGAHLDVESEATPDTSAPVVFSYLAPRLPEHYTEPQAPWTQLQRDGYLGALDQIPEERFKRAGMSRNGPSLSIINPLDVLRQRLLYEMARRKMRESEKQIEDNRRYMQDIGKRGFLRPYNRM